MQEAYVNIQDVPVHIMTWGKWVEESLGDVKEVVICITGNPGQPGFYAQFLHQVHSELGPQVPVWVIGHQGHDDPPKTSIRKVPRLQGNEGLFDLNGQVQHKADFIEKYVPAGVKIHLIGHSIGCWMILQLLRRPEIKQRVQKCYMLFPTIERMAVSTNGRYLTRIVSPLFLLLGWMLTIFQMLPVSVQTFIFYLYFLVCSIPNTLLGTALKCAEPNITERIHHLGMDEMKRVDKLDVDLVRENVDLLKLYYGRTDGWVPVKYYEEIKQKIPELDAVLDTKGIEHAFVLRFPKEMGVIVAEWIKQNRRRD